MKELGCNDISEPSQTDMTQCHICPPKAIVQFEAKEVISAFNLHVLSNMLDLVGNKNL